MRYTILEVNIMSDYKMMYHILFNKITDIINELQEIQRLTEEMYMQQDSPSIKLYQIKNKNSDNIQ